MLEHATLSAYRPTIAEVNVAAFRQNIKQFKRLSGENVHLLAVVKTNAYGHGLLRMCEEAVVAGADRLGVTTVEEGALLREKGVTCPIHLLASVMPEQAKDVAVYDLTASVSSDRFIQQLSQVAVEAGNKIPVHLKIDVGLHRFGLDPADALAFCKEHQSLPGIDWEGIYTHFSQADEAAWAVTERQFDRFRETVQQLEEAGFVFPLKHVGASTIALERQDMYGDMLRPGIGLFGYVPEVRQMNILPLQPVLQLKSALISVRTIPENDGVGYGATFRADKARKMAIVPIGHGDGYSRSLSNRGEVLVHGKRAPIIGTISLDQTFIDVTGIPDVKEGDNVVLIGKQGDDEISARDVALWMGSIVDEVLAGLLERIPRVYVDPNR